VIRDAKEAAAYAERWAANWNRKDLEEILSHFAEDVVFSSPKALDAMGVPTVRGKAELREYWRRALARIETIEFTVERVIFDAGRREIAIVYDRHVNGRRDRAAEVLRFGPAGLVVAGEVLYGVIPAQK
jgi:ketosteroid isomerase-like protein